MSWFPQGQNDSAGWRLDVISLLAVIGESAVSLNAQPLTSSWLCLLPRLIPAAQGLLVPARPQHLERTREKVTGVYSGVSGKGVSYFANLLHPIHELKRYEFRAYHVKYASRHEHRSIDEERNWCSKLRNGGVSSRILSPIAILTIVSSLWSLAIAVWAALQSDGPAFLAVVLMSLASSLIGLARKWSPRLTQRKAKGRVPDGDVIIETTHGGFVLIRCSESIARELYVGGDFCEYFVTDFTFKSLSGIATMMFMAGVLLLGNCGNTLQIVTGVTFIALNGIYWIMTLMPKRSLWHVARFVIEDVTPTCFKNAHLDDEFGDASFTRTLWYAIYASGSVDWVRQSGAAPNSETWNTWLRLAHRNRKNAAWPAVREKDRLFREATQPLMEAEATGSDKELES